MAAESRTLLSHEEYFTLEREGDEKHEYVAGEVFAMVGGSLAHSQISVNTSTALNVQLQAKPCIVNSSDLRVAIRQLDIYTYPDVSVVCGEPQFAERGSGLLNPTVIIEVLSPATERYDRGQKFLRYQRLTSLHDYVLIAQSGPLIERFSRDERGRWFWEGTDDLDTSIALPSIECALPLAEVYAKVVFGAAAE
jgi:Uma2 family endonuclease